MYTPRNVVTTYTTCEMSWHYYAVKKENSDYSKVISLGFDGTANIYRSITEVWKRLFKIGQREIPNIHFKAHFLSLALFFVRNTYVSIKQNFQVFEDICKLFHKSVKHVQVFRYI